MSSIVELPIRLEESDKLASLDDVLGTLKVVYTPPPVPSVDAWSP